MSYVYRVRVPNSNLYFSGGYRKSKEGKLWFARNLSLAIGNGTFGYNKDQYREYVVEKISLDGSKPMETLTLGEFEDEQKKLKLPLSKRFQNLIKNRVWFTVQFCSKPESENPVFLKPRVVNQSGLRSIIKWSRTGICDVIITMHYNGTLHSTRYDNQSIDYEDRIQFGLDLCDNAEKIVSG